MPPEGNPTGGGNIFPAICMRAFAPSPVVRTIAGGARGAPARWPGRRTRASSGAQRSPRSPPSQAAVSPASRASATALARPPLSRKATARPCGPGAVSVGCVTLAAFDALRVCTMCAKREFGIRIRAVASRLLSFFHHVIVESLATKPSERN